MVLHFKLNSHHQEKFWAILGWNCPNGSGEQDIYISMNCFCYLALSLNSWMICAKFDWNWPRCSREKDFLNVGNVFSLLSPLGKGHRPSFDQTCITIIQGCFVPSLVEICPVALKKKTFKCQSFIFDIFPWKRAWWFKHESSLKRAALCQVWLNFV